MWPFNVYKMFLKNLIGTKAKFPYALLERDKHNSFLKKYLDI